MGLKNLANTLGILYIINKSAIRQSLIRMVETIDRFHQDLGEGEVVILHINSKIFSKYIKDIQNELMCDVVLDDSLGDTEFIVEVGCL